MFVIRGRATSLKADRDVAGSQRDLVAITREPAVRVWRPHRHVSFGPRDVRHERFEEAVEVARSLGYESSERSVGGHAVAYTGSTLAFARVVPIDDPRHGLTERYAAVTELIERALNDLEVEARTGEPPASFCPGDHSLSTDGKIVGIAQRVTADAAIVSGIVVVRDHEEIATVLERIYDRLGVAFDPASVSSVARSGGPDDPKVVSRAIEHRLLDGAVPEDIDMGDLDGVLTTLHAQR